MLLKVGTAMMLLATALAAVVVVVVNLSGPEEEPVSQAASVDPLASGTTTSQKSEFDPGKKLEIDRGASGADREEPSSEPPAKPEAPPSEAPPSETLPVGREAWPEPSEKEVAATQAPRYYPQRNDSELSLTVGSIGLYDVPVITSNTRQALDNGVIHLPQTPMPWEEREQKNVYLAGHRLGWPGTGSRLVFYNLDKLKSGDKVVLKDSLGDPYEYRVSEVFVADPNADWAVQPVRGRDMVTLQTCTFPDLKNRLIVRADRV